MKEELPEYLTMLDFQLPLENSLSRLEEGVYLNDIIINFMLRVFEKAAVSDDLCDKVTFMNSYFYTHLSEPSQHSDEKMLRILRKKLTRETCFIVIPINLLKENHWSLAIISNLNLSLNKEETDLDINTPAIIYLDSMFKISSETLQVLQRVVRLSEIVFPKQ